MLFSNLNLFLWTDLFLFSNELLLIISTFIYIIYTNWIVSRTHNAYAVLLKNGYYILILFIGCFFILQYNNIIDTTNIINFNYFIKKNITSDYLILFIFFVFTVYSIYSVTEQQTYKITSIEYIYVYIAILYSIYILGYSHDLLTLYLGIELLTISSYVLIFLQKYSVSLIEIGMKYFIWNSIISVLFLYTIHLIYVYYATIDINQLYLLTSIQNYEMLEYEIWSIFFLIIIITFKIGLVPFHIWMLEIYEGSLENTTLFFLLFPKLIIFLLFFKNIYILFELDNTYWKQIGIFNIIITGLYSSLLLLKKTKLKSSLIYMGLLSSGFLYLDSLTLSTESIFSIYIYIIIYCIHIFLFFFIKQTIILTNTKEQLFNIYILNRLHTIQPWIAFSILILFFSLLGIPPFAGFFSKLYLLYGVFIWNDYFNIFLILSISLISSFLYLYIIKNMYLNNTKNYLFIIPISIKNSYIISVALVALTFLFIYSTNIFLFITKILIYYHI